MSLDITWRVALDAVGAATILYACYKLLDAVSLWLLPIVPLTRYQRPGSRSWALVTGASAGIGLGCAHELAARGFNVVILSHKADELADAKAAIEAESPAAEVRVLVLDVARAAASDIEAALEGVSSLQPTVLVNVHPRRYPLPSRLRELTHRTRTSAVSSFRTRPSAPSTSVRRPT